MQYLPIACRYVDGNVRYSRKNDRRPPPAIRDFGKTQHGHCKHMVESDQLEGVEADCSRMRLVESHIDYWAPAHAQTFLDATAWQPNLILRKDQHRTRKDENSKCNHGSTVT